MEAFLVFLQKNPLHLALFGIAVISGGMILWPLVNRVVKPGREVGPVQAVQLINRSDAVVIDVREVAEFNAGHIAGARHIPQAQLAGRVQELDKVKGKPLIVTCASGNRSRSAAALLQKHGHADVFNLEGGLAAWRQAGMPVEK